MKYESRLTEETEKAIDETQRELYEQARKTLSMARRCPYCNHVVDVIYKGTHGYMSTKCPKCSKSIIFAPVQFRTA